jgi:PAS domain S-box-containing protein
LEEFSVAPRADSPVPGLDVSRIAGCTVIVIATVVLGGWAFGAEGLTRFVPGFPPMMPNTAASLVFIGLALCLAGPMTARPSAAHFGRLLAVIPLAVGVATLLEYLLGVDLGIDRLLLPSTINVSISSYPGRTSPHSAAALTLLGCALIWLDARTPRGRIPSQLLASGSGLIALVALTGALYGASGLYGITHHTGMGLNSALAVLVATTGVLAAQRDRGVVAMVLSNTVAGRMARSLLPFALLVPIPLGWLRLAGERAGYYDAPYGVAIMAIGTTSIFVAAVLFALGRVYEMERAFTSKSDEYEDIVENASDFMYTLRLDGRFTSVNPVATRAYGYTANEFTQLNLTQVVDAQHHEAIFAAIDTRFEGTGRSPVTELLTHAKDGRSIWIEVTNRLLFDGDTPVAIQGIARDITERRRAEERPRSSFRP